MIVALKLEEAVYNMCDFFAWSNQVEIQTSLVVSQTSPLLLPLPASQPALVILVLPLSSSILLSWLYLSSFGSEKNVVF